MDALLQHQTGSNPPGGPPPPITQSYDELLCKYPTIKAGNKKCKILVVMVLEYSCCNYNTVDLRVLPCLIFYFLTIDLRS